MALVRYNLVALALNNTIGRGKNVVANARVNITLSGGGLATIYSDEAGTVVIPIPTKCDSKGELGFWVEEGAYQIKVGAGSWTDTSISSGGGGSVYTITPYNGWYGDGGSYFPPPIDSGGTTTTGIHDDGEASFNAVRGSRAASIAPGLPPGITYWQFGYARDGATVLCFFQLVGATGTEVFELTGSAVLGPMTSSSGTYYNTYAGYGLEDGNVWVWDLTGDYTYLDIDFDDTDLVILTFS